MKIEKLDPIEILPLNQPNNYHTVHSLRQFYESPDFKERMDEIPYIFVHYIRSGSEKGIYMVDGHHRTGVAEIYRQPVNAIFLNTFKDLADAYVMRDMELIPNFDHNRMLEGLHKFSKELPRIRNICATPYGIYTFKDFAERILDGRYLRVPGITI